jgi:hypothetical protein
VAWDQGEGRWDTGRRAMLAHDPDCTHHVVIQDDIIPCRDLLAGIETALACVGENVPLCGYVGHYRNRIPLISDAVYMADAERASFVTMHTLNWGPCIVVPTAFIPDMIDYCDQLTHIPNYDRRLSRYWENERHTRIWYTWPSLVDHRRDEPSTVPGRIHAKSDGRTASRFLGRDRSALDVDWTGPVVHAAGGTNRTLYIHWEGP